MTRDSALAETHPLTTEIVSDLNNITRELEDEGDRVFLGSTNDADRLIEIAALFDEWRSDQSASSDLAGWRPIETAPKDGTLVLLLVDYSGDDADHRIDDRPDGCGRTIGHNNDDNVGPDEGEGWQFAGWCWSHDHYVEGLGVPIRWRPLPEFHEIEGSAS